MWTNESYDEGVSCPVWAVALPPLHNLPPMNHPHFPTETNNINQKTETTKVEQSGPAPHKGELVRVSYTPIQLSKATML